MQPFLALPLFPRRRPQYQILPFCSLYSVSEVATFLRLLSILQKPIVVQNALILLVASGSRKLLGPNILAVMRLKPTIVLGRPDEARDLSIQNLLCSFNFWLVFGYSIFLLAAYNYCSVAFTRDPTSFFFDPTKGYQRVYSLKREKEAAAFIEAHNHSTSAPAPIPDNAPICLGVATIGRSGEQYVRNTIGSLLEGLSEEQRNNIHLAVFFAQTDPQKHPIYHEPWLKDVANELIEYKVSDDDLARLRSFESQHQFWNKSMYDYEYLLQKCLDTGAQWIMLVEDDIIAKAGWYTQATSALKTIQAERKPSTWLYLRLFYTEKLFGWNSEEWMRYLGWSVFVFLATAAGLISARAGSRRLRKHLSNLSIAIIVCLYLPASILLYFMAGRLSMQPPSRGLQRMETFGCCSQGLIYPREIVPRVMDTVRHATNRRYYVDMTLERWGNAQNLARYALVPPLLQHVGSHSSKGNLFDEGANSIWNFEFENYS